MVIGGTFRPITNKFFNPIGKRLAALGFSPNFLSFTGIILGIAAAWTILIKAYIITGILGIFIAFVDSLDGAVARASNRVTKFGSYLDGMLDRYVESIIILAAAYSTGYWILAFIVLFGSFGTSYAKARAALETKVDNAKWPDLMERLERGIVFILAFFLQGIFKSEICYQNFIFWGLVIIAIGANITVIQRMFRAKNLLQKE